jgi:hypothetical protein
MATETATKQNDTKPAETAKPTAAKSRRTTSRTRKPAASRKPAAARRETTTTATPRAEAKVLNGGQQFVAGVIEAQEKTVTAIVEYQTRAAELSQIPGATAIAEAQAKVLRGVTDTYVSAARTLLK